MFLITVAKPNSIINNRYTSYTILFCFILFTSYKIANLDMWATTDLHVYINQFYSYQDLSLIDTFKISKSEPLFTIVQWSLAQVFESDKFFKLSIWLLFTFIFIKSLRNIFLPWQVLVVFFSYMTYFIFFSYILNTMRQGIAISLLMLAISLLIFQPNKKKLFVILIILAPLFHMTALPLSVALLLLKKFQIPTKLIVGIWIASIFLFLTGLNQTLFGSLNSIYLESYTADITFGNYGGASNKITFLLFSIIGLIVGWLLQKYLARNSDSSVALLRVYLVFNSYFLLLGFIAFSDRIASYSWFLIPLMVWLPIFKSDKKHTLLILLALISFIVTGYIRGSLNLLF
ncbi:MAG: EpsG family protein [Bacillota bacterium]